MGELSPGPRVPSRQDSLEFLGDEATVINLYGGPGNALGGDGVGQGREGELIGKEGVSPVTEEAETLCNTIAVPESQGDHVVFRRMEDVDEFGHGFEGGRESGTGTVSEGGLEGEGPRTFSIGEGLGGARAVAPFKHRV